MADFLLFTRLIFTGCFLLTLAAGVYLALNFQRFFGADPAHPSENGSARAYSRVSIFSVWAHALLLFGALALFLR